MDKGKINSILCLQLNGTITQLFARAEKETRLISRTEF